MAIGIIVTDRDTAPLKQAIQNKIPDVPVWVYPSIPDKSKVEMLVVWKQPKAILGEFPNLKLVSSLGAGVEHLLNDPHLPKGVPITRIVDPQLSLSMQRHVLLSVLHFHKRWGDYALQQSRQQWQVPEPPERKVRIGILGVGALGQAVGAYLLQAGFDVLGYSRTRKAQTTFPVWDAQSYALTAFAKQINVLVCLLPNTAQTQGILSASLFQALPMGSCLINVGRGVQLVESDL
ncbi:MAG: NAD(P)-binding domain-containing protein, partial [Saprospiraceae bacterium]|nr:NAD(P)-binding domain-containing protein [Saprospiraceae bacterium]